MLILCYSGLPWCGSAFRAVVQYEHRDWKTKASADVFHLSTVCTHSHISMSSLWIQFWSFSLVLLNKTFTGFHNSFPVLTSLVPVSLMMSQASVSGAAGWQETWLIKTPSFSWLRSQFCFFLLWLYFNRGCSTTLHHIVSVMLFGLILNWNYV